MAVKQRQIRIPDLPSSVVYTEPKLPEATKDAKATSEAIKAYEEANEKNKFAIEQAIKANNKNQKIYNSK